MNTNCIIIFIGKGTLNLDANGISNVGKAHLDLGVGDGGIYIPGLNNLFVGKKYYISTIRVIYLKGFIFHAFMLIYVNHVLILTLN